MKVWGSTVRNVSFVDIKHLSTIISFFYILLFRRRRECVLTGGRSLGRTMRGEKSRDNVCEGFTPNSSRCQTSYVIPPLTDSRRYIADPGHVIQPFPSPVFEKACTSVFINFHQQMQTLSHMYVKGECISIVFYCNTINVRHIGC